VFETALLSLVLKVDQGRFKVECEGAQRSQLLGHWREGSARPRIRYCLVRSIGPSSHRTRAQTRGADVRLAAGEQSGLGESDPACPPTLLAGRVREGERGWGVGTCVRSLPHWREGSARPRIRYCLVRSIGPSSHRTERVTQLALPPCSLDECEREREVGELGDSLASRTSALLTCVRSLPHWREGSARPRIRYCLVRSIGPSSHRSLGESDPACPPTLLAGRVREGERGWGVGRFTRESASVHFLTGERAVHGQEYATA
jgi:hypothetical protein